MCYLSLQWVHLCCLFALATSVMGMWLHTYTFRADIHPLAPTKLKNSLNRNFWQRKGCNWSDGLMRQVEQMLSFGLGRCPNYAMHWLWLQGPCHSQAHWRCKKHCAVWVPENGASRDAWAILPGGIVFLQISLESIPPPWWSVWKWAQA